MKKHFGRIIIDKPSSSHGAWKSYRYETKNVGPRDDRYDEDSDYWNDQRETMARYDRDQADRLSPLYQFLIRNCGRNWNDVWADICEFHDQRNMKGFHLRFHVLQWVENNGISKESPYRWYTPSWGFYVDDNHILREYKYKRYRRKPVVNKFLKQPDNGANYVLTEHGWFNAKKVIHPAYDVAVSTIPYSYLPNEHYFPNLSKYLIQEDTDSCFKFVEGFTDKVRRAEWVAFGYRQCDKNEIRAWLK
jgi:hypothetical protein